MVESSKKERSGIRVDYKIESVIGKHVSPHFYLRLGAHSLLCGKVAIERVDKKLRSKLYRSKCL